MPRESRISATRPVFPTFILPSFPGFRLGLGRRRASASSASSASAATAPGSSPPDGPPAAGRLRLSRAAPDTLRCINCSTDLALASQIISKGFTGRYGRAFLVTPPAAAGDGGLLANIRVGRSEDRQLVTGWHVVADICCATCSRKLGWKYVDAKEPSQRYKVGKYILEVERVVTHRCWEDGEGAAPPPAWAGAGEIDFDSEDDDECEDIFMGVWDAEAVAKRRSQTVARRDAAAV